VDLYYFKVSAAIDLNSIKKCKNITTSSEVDLYYFKVSAVIDLNSTKKCKNMATSSEIVEFF